MRTAAESSVEVETDPATAFRIFTEELDLWWVRGPINYYDSSRLAELRLEPGIGGRVLEIYDEAAGDALVRERVTVWEPGSRLVLQNDDTEIDIRFEKSEHGTCVRVSQYLRPEGDPARAGFGWVRMLRLYDAWSRRRETAPRRPRELDRLGLALYYTDPAAAARWLRSAFQVGDWDVDRAPAEGEEPNWIEFHVGNALVMLFNLREQKHNTWIYVDDLDAHYEHAKAAGATIVSEPKLHGSRRYEAADLEGHRWTFVQARPTMRLGPGPVDPLASAVAQHDENTARSLIKKVDPHQAALLLHHFAIAGNAEAVETLIGLGVDVNTTDDVGATALHHAAGHGQIDCVTTLINARANLDLRDHTHASSPVLWARNSGHTEIVELLLARGARLNAPDAAKLGLNAVLTGFLDDVPESLDRAVGWPTPLTGAITGEHPDTVRLLLDRGADPNGSGGGAMASLRWVEDATVRAEVDELLREYGAEN
jgi:uncharacterized glyoxalase superfamily protein PhnB